jgi:hypothetical protein
MSLPDLAAVLWRQRELLERLVYRLECEQLLLAAGRSRWLGKATSEVEALLNELAVLELQRGAIADGAARELGLPADTGLQDLAAAAQPPWTQVLLEHRNALLTLTTELAVLAETNRHLVSSGMAAVETTLAAIGVPREPATVSYDSYGRGGRQQRGATRPSGFVDRAL